MNRMRLLLAILWLTTAATTLAGAVSPEAICTEVRDVARQAELNFQTGVQDGSQGNRLLDADDCTMSIAIGGARTLHCHWQFEYRAESATNKFDDLHSALKACSGDTDPVTDQQVNHPDFYDQARFDIDGIPVTVSLKDKGALQQTLVFLAIEGVLPDE